MYRRDEMMWTCRWENSSDSQNLLMHGDDHFPCYARFGIDSCYGLVLLSTLLSSLTVTSMRLSCARSEQHLHR